MSASLTSGRKRGMPVEKGCVFESHLVLDRALRYRPLLDVRDRCSAAPIQQEQLAALRRLHERGQEAAVGLRQVDERGLRRHVVVPHVVMHGLEAPAHGAVGDVERDDRARVFLRRLAAMRAEEVRRAVAGRRVDEPELVVVAHQRPDVRRAARVLLAVGGLRVDARPSHVPRPRKLPGDRVVSAHDARGLVDLEVVRDARADDREVACDQRRRRHQVDVRLRFADALHQVDCTFGAEAGAALAGLRINRHEARIGRAHDDARRTIAAVAFGRVVVADAAHVPLKPTGAIFICGSNSQRFSPVSASSATTTSSPCTRTTARRSAAASP